MKTMKKFYIAAASVFVAVGALVALNLTGTDVQAMSSFRNCNADAIMECGAISQSELLDKYDQNAGDVKSIYRHYGISRADLSGTNGEIKAGTVYKDGRVVVNGKTVATGAYSVSRVRFTSAGTPRNVTINGTTYYEGPNMQIFTGPVDAFVIFRDGKFYKAVLSSCGNPVVATPEEPEHEPVYACDNLKATELDRTRYRFTASASAEDGAEIVSYTFNFGDGSSKTTTDNVIEHRYDSEGTYNVTVSVKIEVNGTTKYIRGENCKTTVTVEEEPEKPVYKCENLTARHINDRTYEYTLNYTSEGGATLDRVVYNFGDGVSETFSPADSSDVQHAFATDGTYTTTATLYFDVPHEDETIEKSDTCEVKISIDEKEMCPVPGKEHLPKDSEECYEPCPYPGKEHLPKDSLECEETPPELPKTGLDMFIGGGIGLGSISAAGYYWSASRKNLLRTLLNR